MRLIIDGNNVLHAPMPAMIAGLDEVGLCAVIGRTPWPAHGVLVVFDGKGGMGRGEVAATPGVDVVYSGRGRTADEVIIGHVREHTAPRNLVVVSSDHEIRKAARRRRATVWSSDEFVHRLVEALRRPEPARPDKPADPALSEDEVRDWLSVFGIASSQPKRRPPLT